MSCVVDGVLVHLFPRSSIRVEVERAAALHLASLLHRYNWTLTDPARRSDRWRRFWPNLTQEERQVVVFVVSHAIEGRMGSPVDLDGFHPEGEGTRAVGPITRAVQREFVRLVELGGTAAVTLH